jgi:hypothetical protein
MPGNGNGEHAPKTEQTADEALAALASTLIEGMHSIALLQVDTLRDVTSLGVPGWSRLCAGIQFGGVRRRIDVEPGHAAQCLNRSRDA